MTKKYLLAEILDYTRAKVASDKLRTPQSDLERMIKDAQPVRNFRDALRGNGFGIIAEIKQKSPSAGSMRRENVHDAPSAYSESSLVRAVSVLTSEKYFGMSINDLHRLRPQISPPILRKDFIVDEYQIYEARAHGADAVLLMANVLKSDELLRFWNVCKALGMDALFESHNAKQIAGLPSDARVCGVNSRLLDSGRVLGIDLFAISRWLHLDFTPHRGRFELISKLPKQAVKVAESGVGSGNIAAVRDQGWNAALIGAAILKDPAGVHSALQSLQSSLSASSRVTGQSSQLQSSSVGKTLESGLAS